MTSINKLIIEKSSSDIQHAKVQKAIVLRNGNRSVDTAKITIASKYNVDENDVVKYIQDEADTTFLVGIYNFQGSCRDESGNNLDGTSTASYKYPNSDNNVRKFKANYCLDLDAAGEEVSVPNNSILDFSKQFDIYIAFTKNSSNPNSHFNGNTTEEILFSKHDGTNGVEIGLKYVSSTWVIYAKVNSTTLTGSGSIASGSSDLGTISHTKPRFIRLYRDKDDVVRLSLDNLVDGNNCSQTITASASNTSTMFFGTDRTQAVDFDGYLHQIRVYCGGYLSDGDSQRVITIAPQPLTMKFIGKVWKIKDTFDRKTLSCKGLTKFILENKLSADIFSDNITSTTTNEPALRTKNIFSSEQTVTNILQGILYKIDSNFIFNKAFSTASYELDGRYSAEGGFLNTLDLLSTMDTATFFTLPTKVLVYEKKDGISTGYTFEHNNFRIINRGKDEVKVGNDLQIYGRLNQYYIEQQLSTASSGGTASLTYTPINLYVTDNNGIVSDYEVNVDGKEIKWGTSVAQPKAKYWYEKITYGDNEDDDVYYYRKKDNTSITKFGRQSRSIFVPQLLHFEDFKQYGNKLINDTKEVNARYTVEVPYLFNAVRENHIITLSNSVMKFPNSSGVLNQTTTNEIVKSIEWHYPEGKTIIECGEFPFDGYETNKQTAEKLSSVSTTTLNTKDAS